MSESFFSVARSVSLNGKFWEDQLTNIHHPLIPLGSDNNHAHVKLSYLFINPIGVAAATPPADFGSAVILSQFILKTTCPQKIVDIFEQFSILFYSNQSLYHWGTSNLSRTIH